MANHRITFYPIGNADTTLIELSNGQKILFDYAHMKKIDDPLDKRIDLPTELNSSVKSDFDVVCFTHADKDHINRFSEFFFLEHADKYQLGNRKKIKELWVPAAVLIETNLQDEALILRSEARFRLKNKKGIRVFSRPKKLRDWCNQQEDISYEEICHLIVDAGTLIPNYSKEINGAEFFVHSPFLSETQHIDRNNESIVIHATFNDNCETKVILGSDINSDTWADIVKITLHFNHAERLLWDIFHISHHCSYLALSTEKGTNQTMPNPEIKWLFETQGNSRCRIVSPSYIIENIDTILPPHFQAANYYKNVAAKKNGEFYVTMEHPKLSNPKKLMFEISQHGCAQLLLEETEETSFVYTKKTERAGNND